MFASTEKIDYRQFLTVQMHVGTVASALRHPSARAPAYVLEIDFGPLGIKRSSSQITALYDAEELIGTQVFAVTNLEPKRVGSVISECLVLGVYTDPSHREVVLAKPERTVANGSRLL